jgi:putative peptidoglycan lipid II flippase
MDEKRKIAKAAGVMSLATFISRILGYVRDMVLAFFFGATGQSDTFFVAFRIPNMLRELFAEGSMSAALIPVLSEYQKKEDSNEARRLVKVTFTFILAVVGSITILGIIFAPQVVSVIAPGFRGVPEKFNLTVLLTRIMFPFLLFISLSALLMGALNVKRVFFIPALAPVMLNITIITSIFALAGSFKDPVIAIALGVVIGGFVQFAFQSPAFFRRGFALGIDFGFGHPGFRKVARLVMPVTLAMAVSQLNIFISTLLASFLAAGSITYLFYAQHLIGFPIGVFGVAMGMAVLPSLSEHALKGDMDMLRDDFSFALRLLFFISVPAMAGLIALREPIVSTLFQRGRFDYAATVGTSQSLLFYSLGIWSVVGARVLAYAFYSMQDTKTPVKAAALALITNVVLSISLMGVMSYKGLALAYAAAAMVNFTMLFYLLRKKLGRLDARRILKSFSRVAFASAVMGAAGWWALRGTLWSEHGMVIRKASYLTGAIVLCVGVYALLMYIMRAEEMRYVLSLIRERFRKR